MTGRQFWSLRLPIISIDAHALYLACVRVHGRELAPFTSRNPPLIRELSKAGSIAPGLVAGVLVGHLITIGKSAVSTSSRSMVSTMETKHKKKGVAGLYI